MFENLVNGISAKYGTYGQMIIDVYKIKVVGHTRDKRWIRDHSEEIITAMTDRIIEIGPENVSHHAYDPAVLNVIDIGPVESRFTSSAKRRFSCAALDGVENGSISAFYGPQNVPTCKPPVKDPAFHLEIVP